MSRLSAKRLVDECEMARSAACVGTCKIQGHGARANSLFPAVVAASTGDTPMDTPMSSKHQRADDPPTKCARANARAGPRSTRT
eukprot:scaffold10283_cov31-Tisochrysis_lutea.AAC.1